MMAMAGGADASAAADPTIRRAAGTAALALALAAGGTTLLAAAVSLAIYNGVWCADDSSVAVVAKNLALGHGYATSARTLGHYGLFPFDPYTSVGPTVLLPAALVIRLVGNQPWAPGMAVILLDLLLAAAILAVHWRRVQPWRAFLYLITFGAVTYAATATSSGIWFSLLGEAPAGLLGVLGLSLLGLRSSRATALGALALGCAVLAKLLAALLFPPAILCIFVWRWRESGVRAAVRLTMASAGLLVAPQALFELWKLSSLGPAAFVALERSYLDFVLAAGAPGATRPAMLSRILDQAGAFQQWLGWPMWMLAAVAALTIAVLRLAGADPVARRQATLLLAGAAVQLAWWLALSNGWPRYALIGLIVYAAGVGAIALARGVALPLLLSIGCATLHAGATQRLGEPLRMARAAGFHESELVRHLRQATEILSGLANERPFVSAWWGAYSDLEYMQPDTLNFARREFAPAAVLERPFILAYNRIWTELAPEPGFLALERSCQETILAADPFYIKRCAPQRPQ
jgi:hypothetical protein